jgi:hypothetical protein
MTLKKIIKNTAKATALVSLLLPAGCKNILGEKDFKDAKWIKYENYSGLIWSTYMKEAINHNGNNWGFYLDKVRERNKWNLTGQIELPDLDGNGKVGK